MEVTLYLQSINCQDHCNKFLQNINVQNINIVKIIVINYEPNFFLLLKDMEVTLYL